MKRRVFLLLPFIGVAGAQPAPRVISIAARKFEFAPAEVTLKVGEPVVFDLLFTGEPVVDYRSLQKADGALGRALTTGLIARGVVKNSQKMYVSLAHGDAEVARTLEAFEDTLKTLPRTKTRR